jgi:hypothetical protein
MEAIGNRFDEKADTMGCAIDLLLGCGKGKGKGKLVPQPGEPDGPVIVTSGWASGYKIWIGDLPRHVDKVAIGILCPGFEDVAVNNQRSKSGHAFSVVTFKVSDLDKAMAAFATLLEAKFDHGDGQLHWATVRWFGHDKGHKGCP